MSAWLAMAGAVCPMTTTAEFGFHCMGRVVCVWLPYVLDG